MTDFINSDPVNSDSIISDSIIDMAQILSQFNDVVEKEHVQVNMDDSECFNSKLNMCSMCNQSGLYVDNGVLVCHNCGEEYGGVVDENPEWRNYGGDDNHSVDTTRCGGLINPLLIESSYGTSIGYTKNGYFNHLKQLNNWQSVPYHERSLKMVFDRLSQCCVDSGLTHNIIEFSHRLFSEVSKLQNNLEDTKLSRGDVRDGLIAACLFYACKEYEASRSTQEIGKICNVDASDVTRGVNLFYTLMKNTNTINLNKYITKYSDFIERYCNNLSIDTKTTNEIMILGKKVDDLKILTKNTPQAMACGCILFVITMYGMSITKTFIAEKCGISVPTITKSYERLLPFTQELVI